MGAVLDINRMISSKTLRKRRKKSRRGDRETEVIEEQEASTTKTRGPERTYWEPAIRISSALSAFSSTNQKKPSE
jgi:hypothetical protein